MEEFTTPQHFDEFHKQIVVNGWIANSRTKAGCTTEEASQAFHLTHNAMNMSLMGIAGDGINFYLNKLAGFLEKTYEYPERVEE